MRWPLAVTNVLTIRLVASDWFPPLPASLDAVFKAYWLMVTTSRLFLIPNLWNSGEIRGPLIALKE